MTSSVEEIRLQLHTEIDAVPAAYRGLLLRLVHSFREGIDADLPWPSATDAFRDGWRDHLADKTYPLENLWDGVDARKEQ